MIIRTAGIVLFFLASQLCQAGSVFNARPIVVENKSPIIHLLGLVRPERFTQVPTGAVHWQSQLDIANYLSRTNKANEYLFIDGETWTWSQQLRIKLENGYWAGFTLPLLGHGRGVFDRSIYYFHDVLQLPQNGRTNDDHDQIDWRLRKDGQTLINLNGSSSDIGDAKVHAGWQDSSARHWLIQLKLPTGDFEEQSGSESFDFGISALKENPDWLRHRDWLTSTPLAFWYGAGITYLSHIDDLDAMDQYPFVATFRTGLAWRVFDHWQLKTQLDTNTPVFNSNIRELGWMPVQFSFATSHNIAHATTLEFSFIEDLRPRVTPDIIFGLTFRHLFN